MGMSNLFAAMAKTSLCHEYVHVSALPLQSHEYAAVVDGYLIMHLKEPGAVFAPPHVKQGSYTRPSTGFCGVTADRCNRIRPFLIMAFY